MMNAECGMMNERTGRIISVPAPSTNPKLAARPPIMLPGFDPREGRENRRLGKARYTPWNISRGLARGARQWPNQT